MTRQTARMRTISGTIREIRTADPQSEFREWALRQLIKSGKFKGFVKVGSKFLINMDELETFLKNPQEEVEPTADYGKLRQIKP